MITNSAQNREARKLDSMAQLESPEISKVPFREVIGGLKYLAMVTRPDIM